MRLHGRLAGVLFAVVAAAISAGHGAQDGGALQPLVAKLVEEAEAAREAGRFAHPEPSIADRWPGDAPPPAALSEAIIRPQHRDAFVDAYIRWQLTSFDPPLPAMDDRTFEQAARFAPAYLLNPKSDPQVIATLRRAELGGAMTDAQFQQARNWVEDLEQRTMVVEEMTRPAEEFREWVREKLGDKGLRPRQWMLATLGARIAGGWPVSTMKGAISRDFSESVNDETLTPQDRRRLIMQASSMVGPTRSYVGEVTWFANNTLAVAIYKSRVTSDNIDNWRKRLAGIDPG